MNTDSLIKPDKILIVGNGFDLACLLPTKYNNFIDFIKFLKPFIFNDFHNKWLKIKLSKFMKELYSSDFHIIQENFNFEHLTVKLNEFHLDNIKKLFEKEFDQNFKLTSNYRTILDNEWLDYFINLKINNDYLWLDFENEILAILNDINKFLKELDNKEIPRVEDLKQFFNIDVLSKEFKLLKYVIRSIQGSINLKENSEYTRVDVNNKILINKNAVLEYLYSSLFLFTIILKNIFLKL